MTTPTIATTARTATTDHQPHRTGGELIQRRDLAREVLPRRWALALGILAALTGTASSITAAMTGPRPRPPATSPSDLASSGSSAANWRCSPGR